MAVPNDSKFRSLTKAISWRVLATMTTAIIVYVATGEWTTALAVGGVEVVAKFLLYYLHERLWNHVSFGVN